MMIINTESIKDAIFEGTVEEAANKYGLNTRTVGAYRRGERNVDSMKLETAMKIAQKLLDEQRSNGILARELIRCADFVFEADTWKLYQQKNNKNTFVKVEKDDSVAPKTYTLSPPKTEAVLILLKGLRELQLQGHDLSDSYQLLVSDYFN